MTVICGGVGVGVGVAVGVGVGVGLGVGGGPTLPMQLENGEVLPPTAVAVAVRFCTFGAVKVAPPFPFAVTVISLMNVLPWAGELQLGFEKNSMM